MEVIHKEKPLQQRQDESKKIQDKYPDKVCVYIERLENCNLIDKIDKNKFLVPNNITVGQFIFVIRKRIKLGPETGLFFFVNNTIISGNTTMGEINSKYKDEDGFLYVTYSGENCFGAIESGMVNMIDIYTSQLMRHAERLDIGQETYRAISSMQTRDLQSTDYDLLLRLHLKETKKTLHSSVIEGFSTLSPSESINENCSICMCSMEKSDDVLVRLPCKAGHVFHTTCIKEWLTTASTCCPLDKEDLCKAMEA